MENAGIAIASNGFALLAMTSPVAIQELSLMPSIVWRPSVDTSGSGCGSTLGRVWILLARLRMVCGYARLPPTRRSGHTAFDGFIHLLTLSNNPAK